jgi:uncharacterized membrane protein YqjE
VAETPHAPGADASELSTPQLLTRLSEQTSALVRAEMRLAQAEIRESAKHAGLGAGLFGGAGVFAWFGFGALVAAAILALDLVLPTWAAALIVAGALFGVAGVAALAGKKQVSEVAPPVQESAESLKHDVRTVQEARHD